jgi:hypothetical protein
MHIVAGASFERQRDAEGNQCAGVNGLSQTAVAQSIHRRAGCRARHSVVRSRGEIILGGSTCTCAGVGRLHQTVLAIWVEFRRAGWQRMENMVLLKQGKAQTEGGCRSKHAV